MINIMLFYKDFDRYNGYCFNLCKFSDQYFYRVTWSILMYSYYSPALKIRTGEVIVIYDCELKKSKVKYEV